MNLAEFLKEQNDDMMVTLYEKENNHDELSATVTVGYLKEAIRCGDTRGNNEVIKSDSSVFKHYTGAEEVKLTIYTKPQRERELLLQAYDVLDMKQQLNSLIDEMLEKSKKLAGSVTPDFFKDAPEDVAKQILTICTPYMSGKAFHQATKIMDQRQLEENTHEERE